MSERPIDLPIQRACGYVVMKPHQVERDTRRDGKTTQAATRLALYRLRKFLRDVGWERVDDETLHVGSPDDFIRNQRTVSVETRCLDRLEMQHHGIVPGFRIPPGMTTVRLMPDT